MFENQIIFRVKSIFESGFFTILFLIFALLPIMFLIYAHVFYSEFLYNDFINIRVLLTELFFYSLPIIIIYAIYSYFMHVIYIFVDEGFYQMHEGLWARIKTFYSWEEILSIDINTSQDIVQFTFNDLDKHPLTLFANLFEIDKRSIDFNKNKRRWTRFRRKQVSHIGSPLINAIKKFAHKNSLVNSNVEDIKYGAFYLFGRKKEALAVLSSFNLLTSIVMAVSYNCFYKSSQLDWYALTFIAILNFIVAILFLSINSKIKNNKLIKIVFCILFSAAITFSLQQSLKVLNEYKIISQKVK